jgi:long-chain acyl-CoA synthetase
MAFETICDLFMNTVTKNPEKHLFFHKVEDRWEGISGSEILTTVKKISFSLLSKGVEARDNIAIMSTNSPNWAMVDYGIVTMGSASVSIYPTLIPSQIEYILNDSESIGIFIEDDDQLQKLLEIRDLCHKLKFIVVMDDSYKNDDKQIINWSTFLESGKSHIETANIRYRDLIKEVSPDDLLTLIYTSGTTGNPKGVMLSHSNMVSNVTAVMDKIEFLDDDIFLSFLPLSHSFERMGGHFTAFSQGATVFYAENMEKLTENILDVRPTVMLSVPRLYEKMYARILDSVNASSSLKKKLFWWSIDVGRIIVDYRMNNEKAPFFLAFKYNLAKKLVFNKIKMKIGGRLRYFVSGGAPLSQEIAEFFAAADVVILEGYGLTETSPVLTANTIDYLRFGTVGKPLDNVEVKIAFDGEILVKGPNIMMGYFNSPEATKEVLDDEGWFSTGDIGELDDDGYLKITDRKKNILVTSGGKNIAPAPMECAFVNSMYVEQAVVLGDKRNFVSALIVPNFEFIGSYLDSQEITISDPEAMVEHPAVISLIDKEVEKAMKGFAHYEKVKKYRLLPELFTIDRGEITPSLKVIRKAVEKNYADIIDIMYAGGKEEIESDL